jgi:hypothetical protein
MTPQLLLIFGISPVTIIVINFWFVAITNMAENKCINTKVLIDWKIFSIYGLEAYLLESSILLTRNGFVA